VKVGVVLPTAPRTGSLDLTETQLSFAEIRRFALESEALGIDSIWVLDHLLFRLPSREDGGIWEAWTLISALAEATNTAELGTLVLCSSFRKPALLAKMAVTLDEVSQGRLILGLGAGWHLPELRAFGLHESRLVDRFDEAIRIVSTLLHTGTATFSGTYYRVENAKLLPRGPRAGAIPLLIGAEGPRMLGLVGAYADAYNTAWYGWPNERLGSRRKALRAACLNHGRDPGSVDLTVGVALGSAAHLDEREMVPLDRAETVVQLLRAYRDLGVRHLICALTPSDSSNLELLGRALAIFRRDTSMRQ
jgi:alkanesulfonate monooxygenase SsuD/methylene tetrahydromethanopterin reductase-like flavin-dependent oxidoreductase (luciferase family)